MIPHDPAARPLDHCVLPTAGLEIARSRYEALGFTVAPRGVHPFGTVNCCIYLGDGTFLEPLAIGDPNLVEAAIGEGNVFVTRDRAFRAEHGEEGFSALVMGTEDADADHEAFVARGQSAGTPLSFSRPFIDASGKENEASFRLAFASEVATPGTFFFTCQRVNAPAVDRSALQEHANGATGLARVVLAGPESAAGRELLQVLTGVEPTERESRLDFAVPNGVVSVQTPAGFRDTFGVDAPSGGDLRLSAIVFRVKSEAAVQEILRANAVEFAHKGQSAVVAPAPGQGTCFAFEEAA